MEEKLAVKINAVELLEKQLELRARKKQYGIIVMSSATEPYLQFEKDLLLTRQLLEVILKYRFPVHIITKSDLVVRDFDLIREIEEAAILPADLNGKLSQKSFITFSFNTVDDEIARIFEPGATPPSARLATMKKAIDAGFLSGVSMMPLIPYITDTTEHLHLMYSTFRQIGAKYVFPATITLFGNEKGDCKTLMFRAIEKYYPQHIEKYESFFEAKTEMPRFYRQAFYKKMKELLNQYELSDRIH